MSEELPKLRDTTDPTVLVRGDLNQLTATAEKLRQRATTAAEAADSTAHARSVDWHGAAADAFRAHARSHHTSLSATETHATAAARAVEDHRDAIARGQQRAGEAVEVYQRGTKRTQSALADYKKRVAQYEVKKAAAERAGARLPETPAPFVDHGLDDKKRAVAMLADARRAVAEQASRSEAALRDAHGGLPDITPNATGGSHAPETGAKAPAPTPLPANPTPEQMQQFVDALSPHIAGAPSGPVPGPPLTSNWAQWESEHPDRHIFRLD